MDFKIDKSKWKPTKLNELAEEISEREDNPSSSKYDKFVGLDNFVSGDLKIKDFGSTEGLTSSAKVFKSGDILFARRNAYLRRASLVQFDGLCSGDAFVLRENRKNIIPGFFTFILNSDKLWDFANSNAAGTMSKRVKWRDLGNYEILLPPKEQQMKLAELLWAADNVVEKYHKMKLEIDRTQQALIDFEYENPKNKLKIVKIRELENVLAITAIQDGNHGELHPKASDYVKSGIPFIMANSFSNGELDVENCKKLPKNITDKLRIGFAQKDDVLLTHKATIGETAIIKSLKGSPYFMLTPQVTYYRVNDKKLLNTFLLYSFRTSSFKNQIIPLSAQSTRAYIGITAQRELKIPFTTDLSIQKKISDKIITNRSKVSELDSNLALMKQIQKQLINQIFN